ncbi:MAG: pilus assembly protein PilM [Oscillospiraceae bacterium]|jgi:hypothetical protein|nr:pilus assembly protein PilM [Oscillospiraceae bacterium]
MKSSIQISRHAIKVVSYTSGGGSRIAVKAFNTYPLPDECVMNGVIIDAAPVIDGLNSLKSQVPGAFKDASLVLDGSFVYTKKVTVPGKLTPIMYDRVIRDEFSEVAQDAENLLCSFYALADNPDGSKQILASGVENIHAQNYIAMFAAAGITLTSIHLGVQTLLRFISSKPELKTTPFVLNVIDDVILFSMIFQDGVSVFQSRTRLYGEDRVTIVNSTLNSLAGINQFIKSQNFADITHSLYIGLDSNDMELIASNNNYPDIRFGLLDIYGNSTGTEQVPADAHYAFLNALMPENAPDVFASIKMLERAKKGDKKINPMIPIGIITAAVIAITLGTLLILTTILNIDNNDMRDYLDSPAVFDERNEIDMLIIHTNRINTLSSAVEARTVELNSMPHVHRELFETVLSIAGETVVVSSISFNYVDAKMSVTAITSEEFYASTFVENLRNNALIEDVYYTAYSTTATGHQSFSIDIVQVGWNEEVIQNEDN